MEWLGGKDIIINTIKQLFGKFESQKVYNKTYPFLILADASVVGFLVYFKLFVSVSKWSKWVWGGRILAKDLKIAPKKENIQYL